MDYINYTPEELEITRRDLWDTDYLPILYKFLELRNGMRILDVGCGTGAYTRLLAKQIDCEIFGIDINENLLKVAQRIDKNKIKYLKQNVYELEFSKDYFDLVTCQMVLSNLSEPKKALLEMKRIIKSNGIIVAIEPCNSASIQYFTKNKELQEIGELLIKVKNGRNNEMIESGSDLSIGPKLPELFHEVNLTDIDAKGYIYINFSKCSTERASHEMKKLEEAVNKGWLKKQEFDKIKNISMKNYPEQRCAIQALPLFIVKGRKANDYDV